VSDSADSISSRIRADVDRLLQRGRKGIDYLATIGPTMGVTPRDLIHQRGTMALYRYRPLADEIYRVPLLLVMALTNRGYILDLAPGQSLVEFLLRQGYDVFVIDWNPPRSDETRLRLEDYTLDLIPEAVARVLQASGEAELNLVGYCMGGVLSTVHAALHPRGPVKNLAVLTTPIDFSQMRLFSHWSDRRYFDVDKLIDATGNVPPGMIYESFNMLRPADQITAKVHLWDQMWNDEFVKSYRMIGRWGRDILPLPGELFRQLTKELMWDNKLVRGELVLGGQRVDLGRIEVPLLHVVAEHDHIVPYGAAKPLVPMVGSIDKEELMLKGGHVSVAAGGNAVRRLWPKLDAWLGGRST
jgi:polyhydroxyalkanoate synthase subunit PhaC